MNDTAQFTGKYESANPVANWLVARFYRAVGELLPAGVGSVAEVGCGAGYSTAFLRDFLAPDVPYRASDISPELVAMARARNAGVEVDVQSIYALQLEDDAVDMVICLETLEHLERPQAALRELNRVTHRYALVSVPREPIWRVLNMARGKYLADFGNTPGHLQHWSKRAFLRLVGQTFDVIEVATPLPWTIVLLQKK